MSQADRWRYPDGNMRLRSGPWGTMIARSASSTPIVRTRPWSWRAEGKRGRCLFIKAHRPLMLHESFGGGHPVYCHLRGVRPGQAKCVVQPAPEREFAAFVDVPAAVGAEHGLHAAVAPSELDGLTILLSR